MASETVFYTDFDLLREHAKVQYGPFTNHIIYPAKEGSRLIFFKVAGELVAMWDTDRELGYILAA
jgi:hypothetical protein